LVIKELRRHRLADPIRPCPTLLGIAVLSTSTATTRRNHRRVDMSGVNEHWRNESQKNVEILRQEFGKPYSFIGESHLN
jgi:hypothetical protein